MSTWRTTAALSRAAALGALGVATAVLFGEPAVMVLTAPFLLMGALGLLHRPTSTPVARTLVDHAVLHEGQGTRSRLVVSDLSGVEHVTRIAATVPHVALHPAAGRTGQLLGPDEEAPLLEVSPRRWGRRNLGEENVAFTSPCAGYRWGPARLNGSRLQALPVRAAFDSRAGGSGAPRPGPAAGAPRPGSRTPRAPAAPAAGCRSGGPGPSGRRPKDW